ncbi:hypothetical protein [Actinocatenispora comari]|uniref:hypothetical protein n=1 Tax=Actinocatenispora comari TaxID=2807577 RepID=UPI001A931D46|nr:hypothetical protein [Actinocatenispora comari]
MGDGGFAGGGSAGGGFAPPPGTGFTPPGPGGTGFAPSGPGGTGDAGFAPPGRGAPDPFAQSAGWQPGAPQDDRYQQSGGAPPVVPPPVTVGPPPERGPRLWPKVLAGIVAVVVLAGLLAGSYALVRRSPTDKPSTSQSARAQSPTGSPTPEKSPIDVSARVTDPAPLTVKEVFGADDLHPDPGRDAVYHVLARDEPLTNCAKAARGQVGGVLAQYKCDQVVRATVAAPAKGYVATVGIANLADSDGAQAATDKIKDLGKAGDGALTALSAPGATKLAKSPTAFTLQPYGHYLLYVVVGRTDGKAPSANATIQQIVTDLVQSYLTGVIDARRTAD